MRERGRSEAPGKRGRQRTGGEAPGGGCFKGGRRGGEGIIHDPKEGW